MEDQSLLTPRETIILKALRRYIYMLTVQIHDIIALVEKRDDWDRDNSITRSILRGLIAKEFTRRHHPRLLAPGKTTAPPIYVPTIKGSCMLARETKSISNILTAEPTFRDWMGLNHCTSMTSLLMTTDRALASQQYVKQHAMFLEHEVVKPEVTEPGQRYRLYTEFADVNLKCCPDAAQEIEVKGYRRALYFELSTGADGSPLREVVKKHKGYFWLNSKGAFRQHFANARDMRVIAVCPYDDYRDGMIKAFKERVKEGEHYTTKLRPGADLWMFVTAADLTPETFLHCPIFHTVDGGPVPLVTPPAGWSPPPSGGGVSAGAGAGVVL